MYVKVKDYCFESVNPTTKKGVELLENYCYQNCNKTELWQIYGKNSDAKQNALNYCKAMEKDMHGYKGHITTFNAWAFCYAFAFICDGVEKVVYITPTHDYIINLQ